MLTEIPKNRCFVRMLFKQQKKRSRHCIRFPNDKKQLTKQICANPRKDFPPTKDFVTWAYLGQFSKFNPPKINLYLLQKRKNAKQRPKPMETTSKPWTAPTTFVYGDVFEFHRRT